MRCAAPVSHRTSRILYLIFLVAKRHLWGLRRSHPRPSLLPPQPASMAEWRCARLSKVDRLIGAVNFAASGGARRDHPDHPRRRRHRLVIGLWLRRHRGGGADGVSWRAARGRIVRTVEAVNSAACGASPFGDPGRQWLSRDRSSEPSPKSHVWGFGPPPKR